MKDKRPATCYRHDLRVRGPMDNGLSASFSTHGLNSFSLSIIITKVTRWLVNKSYRWGDSKKGCHHLNKNDGGAFCVAISLTVSVPFIVSGLYIRTR